MNTLNPMQLRLLSALALTLLPLAGAPARATQDPAGDELTLAVIVTRHGVRSPLQSNEELAQYAAKPWPKWDVAPGIQTAHGNLLMAQLADYYRGRYLAAGLLTGDPSRDGPLVFIRTDNDERTVETGRILGKGLVRAGEPEVHFVAKGTPDPLFRPWDAHVGEPDQALALAALAGRMGGDPRNLDRAYASQMTELVDILYGPGQSPPPGSAFSTPSSVPKSVDELQNKSKGPLRAALICTDALLLEYAQGMPEADVGWGRLDGKALTSLLTLHDLLFELTQRTRYMAQVGGSDLASHLVDTLEQAATGEAVTGAIGPSGERIVILVGHDTNIANLGGLLGLDWWIPGTQANPMLPGGALVFELWRHGSQPGGFYIKASYVAQTLDQMREAGPDVPAKPPVRCPIFIPDCSAAGPDCDAPLAAFVRHARLAIRPAFVAPEP
jgi:4-phytase/acid phosphatase